MTDIVVYVNVNEDGEDYDQHDTVEAALAVQALYPNDTIEVRVLKPAVEGVRRVFLVVWSEKNVYRVEVEASTLEEAHGIFERDYQENGHQEDPVTTQWTEPIITTKGTA